MSKKLGLHIGGRRFDVDVDDDFAKFLQSQMERDFNYDGNNDAKTMLQAYVRQAYELYTQNKKIDEIMEKINK
ncbi:hypothetical protein [Sulfurimonas marina]|uniref:Uncharacterized protein n=1 Tax=Sulfurimonas marina TaxID=2590551 RepID=A0A7M1AZ99_9BACT|nr:hypothetical protein [Sulfurimonas marina]QOP41878.1 hypothetical protein FJR03_09075 [Sulfurimonas marina]